MDVLYLFRMDKRIAISFEELATAMTIWLRVMPKRIWQELETHHLLANQKRQGPKPDPRRDVAEYLAGQFARMRWHVSRGGRTNIFSDHIDED